MDRELTALQLPENSDRRIYRARRFGIEADFEGPACGLAFGPGFIFGTDADFDGPDCGLGFGPGFIFGIEADVFFLNPPTRGFGVVCFLKPAITSTLLG